MLIIQPKGCWIRLDILGDLLILIHVLFSCERFQCFLSWFSLSFSPIVFSIRLAHGFDEKLTSLILMIFFESTLGYCYYNYPGCFIDDGTIFYIFFPNGDLVYEESIAYYYYIYSYFCSYSSPGFPIYPYFVGCKSAYSYLNLSNSAKGSLIFFSNLKRYIFCSFSCLININS